MYALLSLTAARGILATKSVPVLPLLPPLLLPLPHLIQQENKNSYGHRTFSSSSTAKSKTTKTNNNKSNNSNSNNTRKTNTSKSRSSNNNSDGEEILISVEEFMNNDLTNETMLAHWTAYKTLCEKMSVGRANIQILESIQVNGTKLVNLVSRVSVRDPRNLVINLVSPDQHGIVMAAVTGAPMGLAPVSESPTVIRVPVPRITVEALERAAKAAKAAANSAIQEIRETRAREIKRLKKHQIAGLSIEHVRKKEASIDALASLYTKKIETACKEKTKSLLETRA